VSDRLLKYEPNVYIYDLPSYTFIILYYVRILYNGRTKSKTPTTSVRGHTRRQWRDVDHIIIIIILICIGRPAIRIASGAERVRRARARLLPVDWYYPECARAYTYALFTRALSALRDAAVISVSRGGGWGFPPSHARCSVYNVCTRV